MAQNRWNLPASLDEALILPLYLLALCIQTSVVAGTVLGIDMNSTLVTLGSMAISWTALISESAVVLAWLLFEIDVESLNNGEAGVAVLAIVIPALIAFVPAAKNRLTYSGSGTYVGPVVAVVVGALGSAVRDFRPVAFATCATVGAEVARTDELVRHADHPKFPVAKP